MICSENCHYASNAMNRASLVFKFKLVYAAEPVTPFSLVPLNVLQCWGHLNSDLLCLSESLLSHTHFMNGALMWHGCVVQLPHTFSDISY